MTDDEIAKALAETRQDETPPARLEDETLAALRSAGLLRPPRRSLKGPLLVVAAIAASLVLGVWIGVTYRRPNPSQSKFLLLLYEDAAWDSRHHTDSPQLEAEYSSWIRSLARTGHATTGEKLKWGGVELVANRPVVQLPDQASVDVPNGFFIILAENEQDAISMAETCPHLKYGGRIVVRPIDR
jgi:hypothetical protein